MIARVLRIWPLVAAMLLFVTVPGVGEPPPLRSVEDVAFDADLLVFAREGQDEALLWITVQIPLDELYFAPGENRARYQVSYTVNEGGRQIDGDVITRDVELKDDRRDRSVLQVIPVDLEPGRYDINIAVGDPDSEVRGMVARQLHVQDPGRRAFTLSSMYLSAESPHRIGGRPAGLSGFPLVDRLVGDEVANLTLVSEIYARFGCRERYRVELRLVDEAERTVQTREEEVPCEGFRTLLALPLDTTRLAFGEYRVELTVDIAGERDEIYREIWFSVDESRLPMREGFPRTLEIVSSIATEEEMDDLRSAPPEEREERWEAFWAARDPDPRTEENEYRRDFFRRFRKANQHFATATTPGWKTDRGQILLRLGEPDRIERTAFAVDQPSREIWIYDDLGRRLVFEDEIGLGDYRLVVGG